MPLVVKYRLKGPKKHLNYSTRHNTITNEGDTKYFATDLNCIL